MFGVVVAVAVAAAAAGFVYLGRERLGLAGAGMAAFRTLAFGALIVLLLNPTSERAGERVPPTVLLDASASLGAAGGRWREAIDTARALAGSDGVILRFGAAVTPFDSTPPEGGRSLVDPALRAAAGQGGPVYVVSDGEISDFAAVTPVLREGATLVLLPRDTVANAALLDATAPRHAQLEDSIAITVEIGTWGPLPDSTATVTVSVAGRDLRRQPVVLPPSPGAARRTVYLPAGTLAAGTHVLTIRLETGGDEEVRDDARARVVTVSAQPAVVLAASPADWESRFLMRELSDVTRATVRGYSEIAPGRWIDMATQQPVDAAAVTRAARGAALVIARGGEPTGSRRTPTWHWPSGSDGVRFARGDWYAAGDIPASPLAGPLGAVEWDSLPPLTGIMPIAPVEGEWTALSARLGRRGAERPALVGRDSAGVREITTAAGGLWRWALRGGASREAYRAVIAAGVDWLLQAAVRRRTPLTATPTVTRGLPLVLSWTGPPRTEPLPVEIRDTDTTFTVPLSFGGDGTAELTLPTGEYRWRVPGMPAVAGISLVEMFSPEYHLGPVTAASGVVRDGFRTFLVNARDRWWIFALVIAALVAEWAWRTRRGLP